MSSIKVTLKIGFLKVKKIIHNKDIYEMKKIIVLTLYLILTSSYINSNVHAEEVILSDGYAIAECNTCITDYDFKSKALGLRSNYGAVQYMIYNDVDGILRTVDFTTRILEREPETIIIYRAYIKATPIELQLDFDN